jgi:YidC/Oxa1 family membrane protein insertase
MEKRVIAAIGLSIAILFAFRYYEDRRAAQIPKPKPPVTQKSEEPASSAVEPLKKADEVKPIAALPAEEILPGRKIVIESDLYRAVIDNRGALLTSWQLKSFNTAKGDIFEMIPAARAGEIPYPGALSFEDAALKTLANHENYAVEITSGKEENGSVRAPATIVMRLRRGDILLEKKFQFSADNYVVDLNTSMQRGNQSLRGRLILGQDIGPEAEHIQSTVLPLSAVSDIGGRIQRDPAPKDENEIKPIAGDVRWAGLDMQYFAEIAVPGQRMTAFDIQKISIKIKDLSGQEISRDLIRLTLPVDGNAAYKIYLGPKSQSSLTRVPGADLSGVIDFGSYLGIIVKPLLIGLRWINQYIHNYGVSIILLTFGLTLILFPFRIKQMVSMKKMQVLQPKIKEIQERYKRYKKTDPKRAEMNQEVMAVYKENNVNPLGGCLPLLLQMPLLFAFYRLLTISIELRHAPFVGWLQDMSAKDPYYILPVVMGITMLISQKMAPMSPTTDPVQAKMMLIMPVVMMFFFLNVSSGLNLYFLCSNVFQIAFQKVAERWVGEQGTERKDRS